jgi:hypothetical protein
MVDGRPLDIINGDKTVSLVQSMMKPAREHSHNDRLMNPRALASAFVFFFDLLI